MKKAVCLLSGGLDSSTLMAIAKNEGYELYALSFDYGQMHKKELEAAKEIAKYYNAKQHIIYKLRNFGGSALVDESIEIPTDRSISEISTDIPATYVPARNTVFLSIALAYAEAIDADAIFIGVNALDYSGYPDCRPEYIEAFQKMANLATKKGTEGKSIKIKAPLINMTKVDIIKLGMKLGVPYEKTWSCYKGGEKACGRCDACILRLKSFKEAGYEDPLEYEVKPIL